MSLDAILAAIEAAGDEEVARIEQEAAEEIAQINASVSARVELREQRASLELLQTAAAESAQMVHRAQMTALQTIEAARQRAVCDLVDGVREKLAAMRRDPDYPRILNQLVAEAVAALGAAETDGVVVEIDPRDEELIAGLALEHESSPVLHTWGGAIVRSGDGRVVVDNTLPTRLERGLPLLRQRVLELLDGEF